MFFRGLIFSLSYFTTLPFRVEHFEANRSFYRGVIYGLPLSGLILSIVVILLDRFLPFSELYSAIFVSIIYLFLYGFLHLEAVADVVDGYFASLSQKDVYSVMKEPQIGAVGAVATLSFVLLKVLAISYLLYYDEYILLVIALVLSRSVIFFALDKEFKSSFANSLKDSFKLYISLKILFFPLYLWTSSLLKILQRNLGFLNGDALGFSIELTEILLLNIGVMFV
jgi:adenosylcobinamide-GDP ribazoletransferase